MVPARRDPPVARCSDCPAGRSPPVARFVVRDAITHPPRGATRSVQPPSIRRRARRRCRSPGDREALQDLTVLPQGSRAIYTPSAPPSGGIPNSHIPCTTDHRQVLPWPRRAAVPRGDTGPAARTSAGRGRRPCRGTTASAVATHDIDGKGLPAWSRGFRPSSWVDVRIPQGATVGEVPSDLPTEGNPPLIRGSAGDSPRYDLEKPSPDFKVRCF
jgi:hypothetical protein